MTPRFDFAALAAWAQPAAVVLISVAFALVLHALLFAIGQRISRRTSTTLDNLFFRRIRQPSRWIFVATALVLAGGKVLKGQAAEIFSLVMGLLTPALWGWLLIVMIGIARDAVDAGSDVTRVDNLMARRKRTRTGILARIAGFVVIVLTIGAMLLSIPSVRSIGVTLMASAGLAGLAVGAAAQPALKNLIAGIQMAFTEPIRLDDVVIMEGEWGKIEEIRLTYVVVRIWDDRRLIVPVSKFLEAPFQNWTREKSEILGTVFFFLDPLADVARLREWLDGYVRQHPKWDGRAVGLQVTDTRETVMEARALVSAANAGDAFDLRCDVREAGLAWLRDTMPHAFPRQRSLVAPLDDDGITQGQTWAATGSGTDRSAAT